MRILLLVHGFPPAAAGGTELYAAALASEFRSQHADEVLVIAREGDVTRPEREMRREQRDGYEIAWINNTWRDVTSFEQSYADEAIGALVTRAALEFAPDVVHVHHLTGLSTRVVPALASRHLPIVVTLHDYWLLCHRGQLLDRELRPCTDPGTCRNCVDPAVAAPPVLRAGAPLGRRLGVFLPPSMRQRLLGVARRGAALLAPDDEAVTLQRARAAHMREVCAHGSLFLAPSLALLDRFRDVVPAGTLRVWPYGVDTAPARSRPARQAGLPLRVGFIGTLMVSKAPHLLLEAAARLPEGSVTVDLVGRMAPYHGDDRYAARLAPLLSQPFVRQRGPLPHDDVAAVLSELDVLVVPSIWPENSPFVVHEAHAAGVVPVVARIGGLPELVRHDENGLLFEPGDAADLARALQRVLDEPGLLDRLRGGRPTPRALRDDATDLRRVYREVIAARRQPPAPRPAAPAGREVVHAVVLDYRTPDQALIAVRSLLAMRPAPDVVQVVDNAGAPSALAGLQAIHPSVRVLTASGNRGYAGGMNVGIDAALASGATHVLLVNSDVVLAPDCLRQLLDALHRHAGAGLAAPVLVSRARPDRVDHAGLSWDARTGRMRLRERDTAFEPHLPRRLAGRVDAVSGCVLLVAREVFEQVGPLDAAFFFGFEDLDFCLRAAAGGFGSVVADAVAYHEGGGTLPSTSADRLYYAARNHLRLARRVAPVSPATRAMLYASVVALNVMHALRARPSRVLPRLTAVAHGVTDALRNRSGPRR